jgi:hypothetical protein
MGVCQRMLHVITLCICQIGKPDDKNEMKVSYLMARALAGTVVMNWLSRINRSWAGPINYIWADDSLLYGVGASACV